MNEDEQIAALEAELAQLEQEQALKAQQLQTEHAMLQDAMGRPDIQNSWYGNSFLAMPGELVSAGSELLGGGLGGAGGALLGGILGGPVGAYVGGVGVGTAGAAYGRLQGKEVSEGLGLAPSTDLLRYRADGGVDLSPTPVNTLIKEALDPSRISKEELYADVPNMAFDAAANAAFGLLPLKGAFNNWKYPQAAPASDLADPSVRAGINVMERKNMFQGSGEVPGNLTRISPNTAQGVAQQSLLASNIVDAVAAELGANAGTTTTEKALSYNFKRGAKSLIDTGFFDDVKDISELSGKAVSWKDQLIKEREKVLTQIDEGIQRVSGGSLSRMPEAARITPEDLAPHMADLQAKAKNLQLNDLNTETAEKIRSTIGSLLGDLGRGITTPRQAVAMHQGLNDFRRNLAKEFEYGNIARGQVGDTKNVAQLEASLEAVAGFQDGLEAVLRHKLGQFKGAGIANVDPLFFTQWNEMYGALNAAEDLSKKALNDVSEGLAEKSTARMIQNLAVPGRLAPGDILNPREAARKGINQMLSPVGEVTDAVARQGMTLNRSANALANIRDLISLNKNPARLGGPPGAFGASGLYPGAVGAMGGRPLDAIGSIISAAQAQEPSTETFSAPRPVQMNLNPIPPAPKQGFQLPRNLNELDPQGVSNMIGAMLPPQIAEPLLIQWKKVSLGGSKEQMAEFLGLLVDRYPDFPIQRGPITGLNSEFDIGDGQMKLFSFNDKVRWEQQIDNSPLEVDERAQRVMALRKSGVVVPMNTKLAPPPPAPIEPENRAMMYLQQTHSFSPREQSGYGNRRVE